MTSPKSWHELIELILMEATCYPKRPTTVYWTLVLPGTVTATGIAWLTTTPRMGMIEIR
jgi:hypothetical protein